MFNYSESPKTMSFGTQVASPPSWFSIDLLLKIACSFLQY